MAAKLVRHRHCPCWGTCKLGKKFSATWISAGYSLTVHRVAQGQVIFAVIPNLASVLLLY